MSEARLRENEAPHAGMAEVLLGLAERLREARSRYDELVAWRSAETSSVEISSNERLSLEPLHHERNGWRPGRLLKKQPRDRDFVEDHFDAARRRIATCEHTTSFGYYEEFFEHDAGAVHGTYFDYSAPEKKAINVRVARYADGVIVDHVMRAVRGWAYESYERDARGRITAIEGAHYSPGYSTRPMTTRDAVAYGSDGLLETIHRTWSSGEVEELYRRPSQTPERVLIAHIVDGLVAAVPPAAASLAQGRRAYCVALEWHEASDERLPPAIAVGLEEQRLGWIAEHGSAARDRIWSMAEFDARAIEWLDDSELWSACEELRMRLRQSEKWTVIPRLLGQVAARLRDVDWSQIIETTDDFVVFEIDNEQAALRRSLKKATTAEQWAQLRARGWV